MNWPVFTNHEDARSKINDYIPYCSEKINDTRTPNIIKGHSGYTTFFQYLMQFYPSEDFKGKIIDIGCFSGLFVDFLSKHDYDATGIEIVKNYAAKAQRKKINVLCLSANEMSKRLAKDSFDIASAINFFHCELTMKEINANWTIYEKIIAFFTLKKSFVSLDSWIVDVLKEAYFILKPKGIFFCNSEIMLPVDKIAMLGFRLKYHKKDVISNTYFWVFEKIE